MKRLPVVFALTLAVGALVFPSSASATHDLLEFRSAVELMLAVDPTLDPPPNDGRHDFAVGGVSDSLNKWGFSAHSGPLGEDPFGHASSTIVIAGPEFKQGRWRVTCVNVSGNLAVVVGVPTRASDNPDIVKLYLRDGGPGGGTPLNPDGMALGFGAPRDECREPFDLVTAATAPPIENGNILIHDAAP